MGLLFRGTAMTWQEAKAFADHVHEHGITQLINLWHREKDRLGDPPLWGDEASSRMFYRTGVYLTSDRSSLC